MPLLNKGKYWTAIMYPENMIDNWEEEIPDKLQLPYAYCIHDKDVDSNGVIRKAHLHIIIAFSNTTTEKHALSIFKTLEKPNCSAIPNDQIEQVHNIRYAYNYLIHDTDSSRKKNKYQYSPSERITGNNFDIGSYEQLSLADKNKMRNELVKYIMDVKCTDFYEVIMSVSQNFDEQYLDIVLSNSGLFERVAKGVYYQYQKGIFVSDDEEASED